MAPYTWTFELKETANPFTKGFIVGESVPLRDRPSKYGKPIRMLSYDVVDVDEWNEEAKFLKVRLSDGQEGYVSAHSIRSAVDYRAIFEKRNGKWQMTTFVAGD